MTDQAEAQAGLDAVRDGFCELGLYICTREWCCLYGSRGRSTSPWRNLKEWQADLDARLKALEDR